ncbi:MAG: hypothetical protein IPP15_07070 [Saprospiraceae bacterium]|uniref:2,4-diaminopentanoate dehydrogenase C-terminal domain-containing protein n=1 Tax=Candidatus Opimibacter skivensis TaxID=2982028 RepID=A0A9D7SWH5_9BACT|nr:hypothetical protein [Candidatus Opimibacter skivensis]
MSGQVAGIRQTGTGIVNGVERIKLTFQASVGELESYDEIEIFGTPHIRSRIMGGVHGDVATCSIILNACHSILKSCTRPSHDGRCADDNKYWSRLIMKWTER